MLTALAILISAILYRVPRGGPSGFLPSSVLGAAIWAGLSAGLFVGLLNGPLWLVGVVFAAMMFGEMKDYMQWVSETHVDVKRLTLRGCLLLNPFMGVIYEGCRRYAKGWPRWGRWIDGWTAYAELGCGLVTACSYAAVIMGVAKYV